MNRENIILMLKDISSDLQVMVEKNEFLRAEIEEYFDSKIEEL